jgi:hypothetical protein
MTLPVNGSTRTENARSTSIATDRPSDDTEAHNAGWRQFLAARWQRAKQHYEDSIRELSSWLASLASHLLVILILAVWTLELQKPTPSILALNTSVEEAELNEEPLDFETAAFDLADSAESIEALPGELIVDVPLEEIDVAPSAAPAPVPLGQDITMFDAMGGTGSSDGSTLEGRRGGLRGQLAHRGGGSAASEKAVAQALDWLARHQHPDGYWSFDHRYGECQGQCDQPGSLQTSLMGATGLALLPYLGAGNTQRDGTHRAIVKRGVAALVGMMQVSPNGGSFYDGGQMYSHGIATMALCEAYAMTRDRKLRSSAQLAVNFTCYAQDPRGGGWRYEVHQPGDTSVLGWQVGALKSADLARLAVPRLVVERAAYFLDSAQGDGGETYVYEPIEAERRTTNATSAIGLLCRMYLGAERDHPVLKKGVERIVNAGPSDNDAYYNFYATQLVFQFTDGQGEWWKKWNTSMRDKLIASQDQNGHAAGSWAPKDGDHGKEKGGRLYATALNCMTLEVYYRLMPIYQQKAVNDEFKADR